MLPLLLLLLSASQSELSNNNEGVITHEIVEIDVIIPCEYPIFYGDMMNCELPPNDHKILLKSQN